MASVSWISLPAPRLLVLEDFEDFRLQDVTAHDDEVRRRRTGFRLLNHGLDPPQPVVHLALKPHHAVRAGFMRGNLFHGDDIDLGVRPVFFA